MLRLVALAVDRLERGRHGTAAFMPHHDDEAGPEVPHRIRDAPHDVLGDDVAGDPDDEEVAEALVEDELRRDPRVAAGQDRGERMLPRGQMGTPVGRLVGVDRPSGRRISGSRPSGPRGPCRESPRVRVRGVGPCSSARASSLSASTARTSTGEEPTSASHRRLVQLRMLMAIYP